jgi:hypothetical protein
LKCGLAHSNVIIREVFSPDRSLTGVRRHS